MVSHLRKKRYTSFFDHSPFLKIGSLIFLFVAVYLVYTDIKIFQKRRELQDQVENYKQQIVKIEQRNKELKQGISESDDSDYIEKVAREELGMQKPGEKVVAFVMPQEKPQEQPQEKSFWNVWFGWLGQSWDWIKTVF